MTGDTHTRAEPSGVIVSTKLRPPRASRRTIPREGLVCELIEAENARLTLVAAPAGSGKTTLLSAWNAHEAEHRAFAWLSLDGQDNDPVHFWDCVIAALRTVRAGIGRQALLALRAPGTSLTGVVVPLLINDVAANLPNVVLVLDDYHAIASDEIHSSLAYLLDFLPANLHIAVATRSDPPLPVGRIRARGQLSEIRSAQLRFDSDEAMAMLSGLGLELTPEVLGQLLSRTEGWAAGLQLAGLFLRGREHPESLVAGLGGDDREITQYLGVEVLDSLPNPLLSFLMRTSILERLHPSLCDAVTDSHDARGLLAEAERRNLFLTRLDSQAGWFSYHQLFRDLLRHRLAIESPEAIDELHRRAARWYERAGYEAEAIEHAIAAGDVRHASELVGAHWSSFFNRGRVATVGRWLAALPEDTVSGDSRLWLATVWTAMDSGKLEQVLPWLEQPVAKRSAVAERRERADWTELLRGLYSFKVGDLAAAATAGAEVSDRADKQQSPFWRTVAGCLLGISAWWAGKPADAERALRMAIELAHADSNGLAAVYATGYLALVEIDRGRDSAAETHLRVFDSLVGAAPQLDEHFTAMVAHVARGRLLEGAGQSGPATSELARACELAARGAGVLEQAYAELTLARLEDGTDEPAAACRRERAWAMVATCEDLGVLEGAQRGTDRAPVQAAPDALSERELGVLRLMRTDLSLREISSELYVSLNTTKTHAKSIYLKLAVSSRAEAVERARELGMI